MMKSTPEGLERAMSAVGISTSDVVSAIINAPAELQAAKNILQDPALPEAVKLINQLHGANKPSTGSTNALPEPGIGLKSALPVLRAGVWAKKNKGAVVALTIIGVLAPVGIGYAMGRASRGR